MHGNKMKKKGMARGGMKKKVMQRVLKRRATSKGGTKMTLAKLLQPLKNGL